MKNCMSGESEFQKVSWDSSHFGYQVAKLDLLGTEILDLDKKLGLAKSEGIKLVYIFVPSEDLRLNELAKNAEGFLADKKVTYLINIPIDPNFDDGQCLESYLGRPLNESLRTLSFQSGVYSRYRVDPNFRSDEFRSLYTEWVEKSLSGEIARDVLVYKDHGEEMGFVTLGEKNGRCNIGLIAVDGSCRRKGVGKKLVGAAFKKAREWGYKEMDVVTQKDNIAACRFYEKIGFKVESVVNIYHFWL